MDDVLHVYGQSIWHDPICIVGTKDALEKLASAINHALINGEAKTSSFVYDGEGYHVLIMKAENKLLGTLASPYCDEIAAKHGEGIWPLDILKDLYLQDKE